MPKPLAIDLILPTQQLQRFSPELVLAAIMQSDWRREN
jgi:hypothetical protein